MEITAIQAQCENCGEAFTCDLENTPYQTKVEPTTDLKIIETRTHIATCTHCGATNRIVKPIAKPFIDLQQMEHMKGNVKTINMKGGPACLVMLGIFVLICALVGSLGYFLIQGVGTLFSWF